MGWKRHASAVGFEKPILEEDGLVRGSGLVQVALCAQLEASPVLTCSCVRVVVVGRMSSQQCAAEVKLRSGQLRLTGGAMTKLWPVKK